MIINGKTTKNIQTSFQVTGSYGSGIATMVANQDGIKSLTLNAGGVDIGIDVTRRSERRANLSSSPRKTPSLGKNTNIGNDDVIDAEFVEKK
eukprot:CAMPEP_0197837860 /NCGR_PEP_ID=MMETSP1437-20131217/33547_1 /TAXON_ID=49252 ORGANISM="Eucampia antarctica, Strain CCMP1452" /NCGR_SAMPLE_ID=MMETSP1437 /ASSEMBLY_ACC=CAM_ASM_001096 /LENGTH=91 /DNA_ID=CAMNT_0043445249 /DNA_START=117 /DNA_END=392 /DNA_ORIENTATION=+